MKSARDNYIKNLSLSINEDTVVTFLLPEYETKIYSMYCDQNEARMIMADPNDFELTEKMVKTVFPLKQKEVENGYIQLAENIKIEARDIHSMKEAFDGRSKFISLKNKTQNKIKELNIDQQKLAAGKQTLKSVFSRKSKEIDMEEIHHDLEHSNEELTSIELFCNIISILLYYQEMENFKVGSFIAERKNLQLSANVQVYGT